MNEPTGQHLEQIKDAHRRLDRHDGRISQLETDRAVSDVRYENIVKSLDKIQSNMSWLIRLIIGSIITGIIAFILAGGLNSGQ